MNCSSLKSFLRRTAAIGVIVAPFLFGAPASATTVLLNNTAGNTCTYTGMTVDPAGNVTVTCQTTTTSGPGTLSVSAVTSMAAPTAPATANWTVSVLRTGGSTGAVSVDYTIAGTACAASTAATTVSFADTVTTTSSFTVPITGAGTCTVTLANVQGGATLGTSIVTVNATASTGGTGSNGVPIVAGCATPDPTTTMGTLPPFNGTPLYPLKHSGEVTSYPLPRLPAGKNMEWIAFGETPIAYTPSPYSMDVSINPCPGVFVPKSSYQDYCNYTGVSQTNGATFYWAEQSAYAKFYTACLAVPTTQYYFNVRWTYTSCAKGAATCGFSLSTGG